MKVYSGAGRVAIIGESNFDEVNLRSCSKRLNKSFTVGKWGRGLYFSQGESPDAHFAFGVIFGRTVGRHLLDRAGFPSVVIN